MITETVIYCVVSLLTGLALFLTGLKVGWTMGTKIVDLNEQRDDRKLKMAVRQNLRTIIAEDTGKAQ